MHDTKTRRSSVARPLFLVLLASSLLALAAILTQQPAAFESRNDIDVPRIDKRKVSNVAVAFDFVDPVLEIIETPSSNVTKVGAVSNATATGVASNATMGVASNATLGVVFTPEFVKQRRFKEYVNLPPFPATPEIEAAVQKAIDRPAGEPQGLLHQAYPPGVDAVVGIAAYKNAMDLFVQFVGSLRHTGYDGNIILGVHVAITKEERDYLEAMDVTMYAIELVPCGKDGKGTCAKGFETLKLEWCRFEMSRQWLRSCKNCTGWNLVMDTRDAFFQAKPFASLPEPSKSPYDLFFIEEIGFHTCPDPHAKNPWRYHNIKDNFRYKPHTELCYGENHWVTYGDRPVLCSGTTIGTKTGIDRFLSVMADEFYRSTTHSLEECRSPGGADTDQWIMIYLYYQGKFGRPNLTRTIPWGTGPVNTAGHACINRNLNPPHSQKDILMVDNATGWILNTYESEDSPARVAPVVHQFDRCSDWIYGEYMPRHQDWFGSNNKPVLSWKQ